MSFRGSEGDEKSNNCLTAEMLRFLPVVEMTAKMTFSAVCYQLTTDIPLFQRGVMGDFFKIDNSTKKI
jgi:hypothetical protein